MTAGAESSSLQDTASDRILFAGAYGSGKTEVAVNFARQLRTRTKKSIHLIDLDVVNPYFRSREAVERLAQEEITVVAPFGEEFYSDRPVILPSVRTLIQEPPGKVIIDVGGDPVGASVLSSLHDLFVAGSYELWIVLNASRPGTASLDGSLSMIWEIEQSSGLRATGIISNTHMMGETTKETILGGLYLARRVAKHLSLPLVFTAYSRSLDSKMTEGEFGCSLLSIERTMLKPWEK